MDKDEARALALARLTELRGLSWVELRDKYLGQPDTVEAGGSSGATYQLETLAVWDGPNGGAIRVFVLVDDGGWRAFRPLSEEFIISPDGSFVGE